MWQKSPPTPTPRMRENFLTSDLSISGNLEQLWFLWQKSPPSPPGWGTFFWHQIYPFQEISSNFGFCGRKASPPPRMRENFWHQIYPFQAILSNFGFCGRKATAILKWIDLVSKNFPSSWGGGFSATKTKGAQNCLKWIDLMSNNFPSSWGRGTFLPQNQCSSKLPEMDRSGVKKFSLILGGGGFSATKTKVAQNCLKWIDLMSKNFPSSWGGGGGFSATKTKVARNFLKWIDLMSKFFPSSWQGGLFCHKNQICSKLPELDKSGVKKFFLILGVCGGDFSATKTKVAQNCLKWIDLVSKNVPSSWGVTFLPQKQKLLEIAWIG